MSLAHAVPPDQRVVRSHRGLPWLVALLIHRCQDMEAGLLPRVLLEGVPLIRPLPNFWQSFCNRTLLVFDMDGAETAKSRLGDNQLLTKAQPERFCLPALSCFQRVSRAAP